MNLTGIVPTEPTHVSMWTRDDRVPGAPSSVNLAAGPTSVATTWSSFHAVRTDGTVWAWGDKHNGPLGDGRLCEDAVEDGFQEVPAPVPGMSGVDAIAAVTAASSRCVRTAPCGAGEPTATASSPTPART